MALLGNLRILTSSAQWLKAYVKRQAHHNSQIPPISLQINRSDEIYQWANDLIRLVGRFGAYLVQSPSSIHKNVIPFCPTESMLYQAFGHLNRNSFLVKGISSRNWDDCFARLTMGGDEAPSKVICKDKYFITMIDSSGTVVVWYAETCDEARRMYHDEWITSIKASKTANLIATAGIRTVRIWDISNGQEIYRIPKSNQGRIMSLAFTSNDSEILIAYDDCTVQCINSSHQPRSGAFMLKSPLIQTIAVLD